ncbi:uncharacterized protein N7515_005636 [Penicillium bovifimosum]|uniref:Uncharacterized protein n=1 Tax=Penicillium bovifimosum TaxID=126998 RepID=A0A9W9GT86_9EURO|nr:uncharacterized protein N7515_005636 [Penicillium bovifimosum]KAJ5129597.1 hypothetical protein N7515_005636 [Penicillium bovifimosum]
MCSPRVLCRLRLERGTTKRPIQDLLKDTIFSIRRIEAQKLHNKDLSLVSELFISEANKVIQLVVRWLKHQTLDELSDLVEGIHHLQQTAPRYHELLNIISNHDMYPTSRSSFLNIIRKISRYWEAARKLYRTAKKFPLVRNMEIQLANLPKKAFEGQIDTSKFPDLCSSLSKLGLAKGQRSVPLLCRNLKIDENAARARHKGAQNRQKLHAEIQIIAFCEMQARRPFPRVVSSSKDACFLCNTFIQLHGRMHTPRAHGRPYPGWRLPILPEFGALQHTLNQWLGKTLRQDISRGLAQRKLSIHPFPNESNLLTLSDSSTTVNQPELLSENSVGRMTSIRRSSTLSEGPPRYGPLLDLSRNSSTGTVSHSENFVETVYLAQGELINDFVRFSRPFHLYTAESLEVHLELKDQATSGTREGSLGYGIERLTTDNFQSIRETCSSSMVSLIAIV